MIEWCHEGEREDVLVTYNWQFEANDTKFKFNSWSDPESLSHEVYLSFNHLLPRYCTIYPTSLSCGALWNELVTHLTHSKK